MNLDPKLAELLKLPPDPNAPPIEEMAPEEIRRQFLEEVASVDKPGPEMLEIRDHEVAVDGATILVRSYLPTTLENDRGNPLLAFFHGGGWNKGNLDTHDSICRMLAHHGASVVCSVDYRLAPEHPFPVPFQDSFRATEWIYRNARALGGDPAKLGVSGDSAGGGLAAAVSIEARDRGSFPLTLQLLLYPVVDLTSDTESKRKFGKGFWLDTLPFLIESYAPKKEDRLDPRASPLLAPDLSRLPPAHIVTAGFDPLRDEGRAFADRLRSSGVPTEYRCYESMVHGFFSLRGLLDLADEALVDCAAFLRRVASL